MREPAEGWVEMAHGYTNTTVGNGAVIVKRYEGPEPSARRDRESLALERLAGVLPVPPLRVGRPEAGAPLPEAGVLELEVVAGVPGQELLERDDATAAGVLAACGRLLARVQRIDVRLIGLEPLTPEPRETPGPHDRETRGDGDTPDAPADLVLVHGDFGPNNLVLDPDDLEPSALVDWEWAHAGTPVEDLAWCEWIVLRHHPGRVTALGALFEAYGQSSGRTVPTWPERHAAMLAACRRHQDFARRWDEQDPDGRGVELWAEHLAVTRSWVPSSR